MKTILAKAQGAIHQAGMNDGVPMITDPTFQDQLIAVLALQTANKPKLIGVESLGWNSNKTRFTSPLWEAGVNGLERGSKILHPSAKTIARYFDFQEFNISEDYSQVTAQARSLLALVVAALTRSFLNQQTPTVNILRTPQALTLLKAVFRPLGQVRPVELGSKWPQVEKTLWAGDFCGYPIFATCPDPSALEGLSYPLFLLGSSGLPLQETSGGQMIGRIVSLSHRIISSLVLFLLRQPVEGHSLIEKQEAPCIREMVLEGKSIIQACCGLEDFELRDPDMPLLQGLLSQIPPIQAQENFRYDMHAGVIFIRCRLLREVTQKQQQAYDIKQAPEPGAKLKTSRRLAKINRFSLPSSCALSNRRFLRIFKPALI